MNSLFQARRWPAVVVLAALALGSLAPLAEAGNDGRGNGKSKRKGRDRDQRIESRARVYGDNGGWRGRDRSTYGTVRDRGYRTDSRWRGSGGSRSRDVYVQQRVVRDVRPVYRSRTVYRNVYRPSYRHSSPYATYTVWRRSNSGAVFAGFVGGLFLGATLANAAPAGFAYYDPYCHGTFATLGAYYSHCGHHHHSRTVHVIEIAGGYDYDDYHYCNACDQHYWGSNHDCDHDDYDDYDYDD